MATAQGYIGQSTTGQYPSVVNTGSKYILAIVAFSTRHFYNHTINLVSLVYPIYSYLYYTFDKQTRSDNLQYNAKINFVENNVLPYIGRTRILGSTKYVPHTIRLILKVLHLLFVKIVIHLYNWNCKIKNPADKATSRH